MKRKLISVCCMVILCLGSLSLKAKDLPGKMNHYQLNNGLTVILYEDTNATNVFGSVTVKAGSYHEPEQSTGLAHYLEHVLFKGTEEIGTTNWESEKIYYQQIILLFEDMRNTSDEAEKKRISKRINELSIRAGEFTINNEFSNLVQSIGGTGLNAGTGYDQTTYYNSFPSYQIERWLELYSSRFKNPVFRGFQAELENVYEEKNMYSDDPFSQLREKMNEEVFGASHPYGRSIIGYTEHLKNPSLKDVIDFFNRQYVPENMVLVLSGDIRIDNIKPLIENTFGSLDRKAKPIVKEYELKKFSGKEKKYVRMTPFPQGYWIYNGVPSGHDDEIALELLCNILSNNNETGVLDKHVLDGYIQYVTVDMDARKYGGSINIAAIPTYDMNAFKFNSLNEIHKIVEEEIEKLVEGNIYDWLIKSVKMKQINSFKMALESPRVVGMICSRAFVNEENIEDALKYAQKVEAITKDDLIKVAKKYFTEDYLAFYSTEGVAKKERHIKKPELEPIKPATGQRSIFAKKLESIPLGDVNSSYVDFEMDAKTAELAPGVELYYTPNEVNDIFSMTIKFGAGSRAIPAISLAAQLMNSAGIMAQFKAHEVKKEFSRLGCSYTFYTDADYTYVTLDGNEDNLEEACRLLAKLYIIPELDQKQMDRLLGGTIGSRSYEKKNKNSQVLGIRNYLLFGDKSPSLTRLSNEEIKSFTLSSLAAEFTKATKYETSVHFVGKTPFPELKERLKSSLAFPSNLKPSNSPETLPLADHEENTIYFVHNKDVAQSDVYIYLKSGVYDIEDDPYIDAFNQYFSGGFNGIVAQELRELRSFAYTANAQYMKLPKSGQRSALLGYIGTQSDNTINAIKEFLNLINEMPQKPERVENIKNYLIQDAASGKPSFRYLSQNIEEWKRKGYSDDPGKIKTVNYEKLTFNDILNFYNERIKGEPIAIAIVGNKNEVDMKALKELGKVKNVKMHQIFKD